MTSTRPTTAHVVLLALACTLFGYGLATVVASRSERPNAVDIGFTRDMIEHHDQAVRMALLVLDKPDVDPLVRNFGSEVLLFQRWEIGIMDTYLAGWGEDRGDPGRSGMVWMNMSTPIASMPGMQTEEQIDELQHASGADAEARFLTMMREHHLGGVHMADYAAERAAVGDVRELAERMARNQRIEANEYTALLQRLELG